MCFFSLRPSFRTAHALHSRYFAPNSMHSNAQDHGLDVYWDKLVILLVVWSVLWYPFDVASFCLPFSALPNLSDINNVADIIFWADLALNFVKVR